MNIDDFKSLISRRGGVAKANRFSVTIPLPAGIVSGGDRGRDLTLLCESTSIPGKQITTFEFSPFGHQRKIPSGYMLEDVSCVFHLTGDFYAKDMFDQWQKLVISQPSYLLSYDDEFKADIEITQLGENDEPLWNVTLQGAYPITVNALTLDANSDNTAQKLNVTFAYNEITQ